MSRHWIGLTVAALLSTAMPTVAMAEESTPTTPTNAAQSKPTGMQVAGGVLMGLGGASIFVGGLVTFIDLSDSGPFSGVTALIVGVPLMGAGVIMTGIGIPLYIVGGKKNEPAAALAAPSPPVTVSVGVGLGSASLKMTF